MSTRKRHYLVEGGASLCQAKVVDGFGTDDWRRVTCYQCQVRRYVRARRIHDKRKAAEARRAARAVPLLEEAMFIPDAVQSVIRRFVHEYPIPTCPECNTSMRRQTQDQWLHALSQQINWDAPHAGWGYVAKQGRLAKREGDRLYTWSFLAGYGTETPSLELDMGSHETNADGVGYVGPIDGVNLLKPKPAPSVATLTPEGLILQRIGGLEIMLQNIIESIATGNRESQARDRLVQKMLFDMSEGNEDAKQPGPAPEPVSWWHRVLRLVGVA